MGEPIEKEQVQPASVDIRLGNTFAIVEDSSNGIIQMDKEIALNPYKGKYQGQKGATGSHVYLDKEIK